MMEAGSEPNQGMMEAGSESNKGMMEAGSEPKKGEVEGDCEPNGRDRGRQRLGLVEFRPVLLPK
jgi:hypothetical protein